MLKHSETTGCFSYMEKRMEKSKNNKLKDYKRTKGKIWVNETVRYKDRKTGSGLTFSGRYIEK